MIKESARTKKDDNSHLITETRLKPMGGGVYPGLYQELIYVLKEICFIRFPQRQFNETSSEKDDQLKSYGCQ